MLTPPITSSLQVASLSQADPRPVVLIIDDEEDIRKILRLHLEGMFDVLLAKDGVEGYQIAVANLPDLILCDIGMPFKNGLELCQDIRANELTRDIPMIMLTGRKDQDMKLDCLAAGASEFIGKPCTGAELKVRASNLIKMYRQQRDLLAHKQRLELLINELQAKDELLARQKKLASLGRISAALIHEINNPLNYALQGVFFLQHQASQLPPAITENFADVLEDIHDGVLRVSRIVAELRDFASPTNRDNDQPADLAFVISAAIRKATAGCKSNCALEVDVPEGFHVIAHERFLVQVIVNLINNGIDATRHKHYTEGDRPLLVVQVSRHEGFIRLSIRDNGVGMTPEVCEQAFDPFFTTKDVGQGMGLGLSVCHTFLTEFGATINVQSKPGEFTEFTLIFPSHA